MNSVNFSVRELTLRLEKARREATRPNADFDALYRFSSLVETLGYASAWEADELFRWANPITEAIRLYEIYLVNHPDEGAAINNLGVLLANQGKTTRAREYFQRAAQLLPLDRNVHRNLQIVDILQKRPETEMHKIPEEAKKGSRTLVAYPDQP